MIKLKRVYETPKREDGFRILVDRLWPRGLSKERARIDLWLRDVAPSDALRKWFAHKPGRWEVFKQRYAEEVKRERLQQIKRIEGEKRVVTLLFGAREERYNNAVALLGFLRKS